MFASNFGLCGRNDLALQNFRLLGTLVHYVVIALLHCSVKMTKPYTMTSFSEVDLKHRCLNIVMLYRRYGLDRGKIFSSDISKNILHSLCMIHLSTVCL